MPSTSPASGKLLPGPDTYGRYWRMLEDVFIHGEAMSAMDIQDILQLNGVEASTEAALELLEWAVDEGLAKRHALDNYYVYTGDERS